MVKTDVYAKVTANGVPITNEGLNTTELYCEYENGSYVIIRDTGTLEIEPDQYTYPGYLPFTKYTYDEMRAYGFLNSSNNWDCPKKAIVKSGTMQITNFTNENPSGNAVWTVLEEEKSSCEGKCSLYQETSNAYTCNYIYKGKKLTVTGENNKCTITYPDGTTNVVTNGICGSVTSSCSDLFYNSKTKEVKAGRYDYSASFNGNQNNYDKTMYDFICGSDKESIEYYCAGNCKYPSNYSINCSKIDDAIIKKELSGATICTEAGILKSFRFIGYLLFVVKIVIPILLIIMGSLDFGKAVVASNQDAVKKAATSFATRIVAGVAIFLLPTIVSFAFSMLPSEEVSYENCTTCLFHPSECEINND